MKLKNKIVLITGGNRGIGLAMAHCFVDHKATVIVCGRNEEKLKLLHELNPKIQTHYLDLLEIRSYHSLLENIRAVYGRIDILINNAAVLFSGDFKENAYTHEQIEMEIKTNVSAPIRLTKLLLPLLLHTNELSVICNITSAVANLPMKNLPVYSATKAALRSFTMSLRQSFLTSNIKIIEAQPPLVKTGMTASLPGNAKNMKMMDPIECAAKIVEGIKQEKELILIGSATKSLYWGSKFFPNLILKNLNKM